MPTDLHLIRHGQSFANVEPVVGGMAGDSGLTPLGHEQADQLARRLREESFHADHLYASTLPRAQQTADRVSEAIGLPVVDDPDLQELRPGAADGLTVEEWHRRWPGLEEGVSSRPFQPMSTGGESWTMFIARAGAALTRLVRAHPDQTIVAVCHGGVIEASFYLAFGLSGSVNSVRFTPTNTGLTHWRYEAETTARPWTLVGFNDATHLSRSGRSCPTQRPPDARHGRSGQAQRP